VRPREPLQFDARLVVPTYYDRDFWPAIRAGVALDVPAAARPSPPAAPPAAAPRAAPRRAAPGARGAAVRPPR
jgi:hypothetical protein